MARILSYFLLPTGAIRFEATELVDKYFKGKEISRADCYVAGFCEEKKWPSGSEAVQVVRKVDSALKDAISQGTYYQLGALYMKKGEKQKGLQAFQHASEMKFDPKNKTGCAFSICQSSLRVRLLSFQ